MTVVVGEPTVEGSTIECPVTPSRELRRFFAEDTVRVDYDADVSDVPAAVASIPALAHVAPVAWANGADVAAPAVDREFLDALDELSRPVDHHDVMALADESARNMVTNLASPDNNDAHRIPSLLTAS
jgi:hypothetical protein